MSQIRTGWTRLENLNLARTLTREASLSVPLATKFSTHTKLGGHRSSHKKIKGCFASRNESSESNECVVEHQHGASFHNEVETVNESKKSKGHECPICLKVFPCGQALGGHKRSHMVGGFESRSFQTIVLQEPVAEIRDFLDLNLPAATKEESNSHADSNSNIPWWIVEENHKQEALVGLIS
ncbi:hypothetical protein JHK85_031746 [Glycine max]|nr:hypothetical protein JHK85_031746 [Glycine max]